MIDGVVAALPISPDSPQHTVVDSLMPDSVKTYTVCHGSVMDVPLRQSGQGHAGSLPPDKSVPLSERAVCDGRSRCPHR